MKCPNCNKEVNMLPYTDVNGRDGYECPECGNRAYVTGGQCPAGDVHHVSGFSEVGNDSISTKDYSSSAVYTSTMNNPNNPT